MFLWHSPSPWRTLYHVSHFWRPLHFATRFIDPSSGFAIGWNYVVSNTSTFALKLTVCAITMRFWDMNTNPEVWIAVFLALVMIFNVIGVFVIGLLIGSDDPSLLSDSAFSGVKASPFVLIVKYAGLNGLDHFMNAIILISVLSIGVATMYGGSRTLTALVQRGYTPKVFTYIDKTGGPAVSVATIFFFSLIAFVNVDARGPVVIEWLQAISGLSTFLMWGSICLAHIRFRQAWRYHGRTLDEILFRAIGGVYGSILGLILVILALAAQVTTLHIYPNLGNRALTRI